MDVEPDIRLATTADATGIADCVKAAYEHYVDRIGKLPGPMLDDYLEMVEKHLVFVAEADGIVGVLVLIQDSGNMLLDNVAVHPAQQGKGLGKRLIDLAESEAAKRGFDRLQLYTHRSMTENYEMYSSLGYLETERKNVQGYDRIYMEKHFAN